MSDGVTGYPLRDCREELARLQKTAERLIGYLMAHEAFFERVASETQHEDYHVVEWVRHECLAFLYELKRDAYLHEQPREVWVDAAGSVSDVD